MLRTALAHDAARSRCATRAARRSASPLPARARGDRDRHAARRSSRASGSRWSATGPACRSRSTRPSCCARSGIEPTVCDARFAKPLDGELLLSLAAEPRAARDGRGERARRRLRLRRARAPLRLRHAAPAARGDPRSASPTATSRTASPSCCTRRSASRRSGSRATWPPRSSAAASPSQRITGTSTSALDLRPRARPCPQHGLRPASLPSLICSPQELRVEQSAADEERLVAVAADRRAA